MNMQWISVDDRLPENTRAVLCFANHQFVGHYTKGHELEYGDDDYDGEYDPVEERNGTLYLKPGWYENEETPGGEYDEVWIKRTVTHWQELPPKPTRGRNEDHVEIPCDPEWEAYQQMMAEEQASKTRLT